MLFRPQGQSQVGLTKCGTERASIALMMSIPSTFMTSLFTTLLKPQSCKEY